MLDPQAEVATLERRINDLAKRVLLVLERREAVELQDLAVELKVPVSLTCVAVGWLLRSRVLDLAQPGAAIVVKLRRAFE